MAIGERERWHKERGKRGEGSRRERERGGQRAIGEKGREEAKGR